MDQFSGLAGDPDVFETDVPNRLDRLPFSRFHWLVIFALGITWILDGLEVTLVGSLAGAISASPRLQLTGTEVGPHGQCLPWRRGDRRVVLRLAHR